jgi:predicted O-methyltransferase YrrM
MSDPQTFINTLRHQAYNALDVSDYHVDLQGWKDSSFDLVFKGFLETRDPSQPLTILEVGSWKGLSTVTMSQMCKDHGFKHVNLIAVDTWLGAPEFWTWGINDSTRGRSMNFVDGYPRVFYTFTKNCKKLGHQDTIVPFPISSIQGADVLSHYKVKADIIYVDAAHEYKPVLADLQAYYPLLKDNGVMFGDDYHSNWPGVIQAVDEFAAANHKTKNVQGVVWTLNATHQ